MGGDNTHQCNPDVHVGLSIELFAGCGGLALGLHKAGWEGYFAVEKDAMAFDSLSNNMLEDQSPYRAFQRWPSWLPPKAHDLIAILEDQTLRDHLISLRGTVSLVAGGPPCQGFSVGGRRDGLDERNNLVFRMLEFVKLVRPASVLVENVEGMARRFVSKPGRTKVSPADDVVERLDRMGYLAAFRVVDSSMFGVPQARRRVVIFGVRKALEATASGLANVVDTALENAAVSVKRKYRLPQSRRVTVEEALHDLAGKERVVCPDSTKFHSTVYGSAKSRYARLMRRSLPTGTIPDSHRFSKHGPTISSLYQLAHKTQPPGRLSKQFLLSNGTKKDKKVLINPKTVVSTITTHPDEFIHYLEPRNVTVREMARLQSFPDDFRFCGRYTINGPRRRFDVARCSQVGNAVPPLMAEGLGLALIELFRVLEVASCKSETAIKPTKASRHRVAA